MRVVFMGTPDFAVPSLQALDEAYEVVAVVTRPDAVRGRGKKLEPSPVKRRAEALGLLVIETKRMTPEVVDRLRALQPDILCVAAFGCILPDAVLDLAPLGCVNVHASLLPRWRGAAPVPRAVLAGDAEVGVSIMEVVPELDAGRYCLVGSVPAEGKTASQLLGELSCIGAELLVQAVRDIADNTVAWAEQDESLVTYADKISKAEMRLAPEDTFLANLRRVLASSDAAPARLSVAGKGMRVLAAQAAEGCAAPGTVSVDHGRVTLGCSDGTLELLEVKPDGKRAMTAKEWAAGVQGTVLPWQKL